MERIKFLVLFVLLSTMTAWAECDYAVYYTYGAKEYYLAQGDDVVNVSTILQHLELYGVCTDVQTFDEGSEDTGILSISKELKSQGVAGAWYSLEGVRLSDKPTTCGIYINNGNKVIIK